MAIGFVGSKIATQAASTTVGGSLSLNAGLTGGSASAVSAGDLVIAVFGTGSTADRTLSITDGTNNYTLIGSELYANDNKDRIWETGTDNFNVTGQYTTTTGTFEVHHELTPYVGLVWDLTADHVLYLSYTDIFNPQNYKDKDNNLLNPVLGTNLELGLKSNLLEAGWRLPRRCSKPRRTTTRCAT